jgi:GNAT superfamily N-acetyltransferase
LIRPGLDSDAPAYIRLIGDAWAEFPGVIFDVDAELPELHRLACWFSEAGGRVWVAEEDGRALGMVGTRPLGSDQAFEICKMYLDRAARGSGLAQRLIATAEGHAREQGAQRMVLWTDTRFEAAHRFYEKQSYVRQGAVRILDDLSKSLEFRYAKPLTGLVVDMLDGAAASSAERRLADIMIGCVAEGGSLHWRHPLALAAARAQARRVAAEVAAQHRLLLAAWAEGRLAGSIQLDLAMPESQPHRAVLQDWRVDPSMRGRGVGRALLSRAEQAAERLGRRLLSLETPAGGQGERLLLAAGWREAGRIPGLALNATGEGIEAVRFIRG